MKRLRLLAILLAVASAPVYADSVGIRGAVADFGDREDFNAYEMYVALDMPWAWNQGETVFQTQFEVTGGVIDAAGQSGFLGTLGPRLAIQSGSVTLDVGAGVAVLGETEFGGHDFGGSPQYTAQAGLSVAIANQVDLGVRVRHMSDAGTHDSKDDLNLVFLELGYRFNQ